MKATYHAEYICRNCGNKLTLEVEFGAHIPMLVPEEKRNNEYARIGTVDAPICKFCGCDDMWSRGEYKP